MEAIKVLEVSRVPPSPDSPESATEFTLPLTFFDTYWFKFPPIQRVFYFQLAEPTHPFFNSTVVPTLKLALAITLAHYIPLAGDLAWPAHAEKPYIQFSPPNGGVQFTIAESNDPGSFPRLAGRDPHDAAESHPYAPELRVSDSAAAPVAVQATLFAGHGFALGLTSHHAILDGRSVAMFVNCWAHVSKALTDGREIETASLVPEEMKPWLDRSVVSDPDRLDLKYLKTRSEMSWGAVDPNCNDNDQNNPRSLRLLPFLVPPRENLVRAAYEFTPENITRLRGHVAARLSGGDPNLRLSSFVLTYSYTLRCIAVAKPLEDAAKVCMMYMVDCRGSPVPENYLGNCITYDAVVMEAGEMRKGGVAAVAARVAESVRGFRKGGAMEVAKGKLTEMLGMDIGEMEKVATGGSARFGFYGRDFGWGRPLMVEMSTIAKTGAVSLAESRDGRGGVEVGVAMERAEMDAFGRAFVDGLENL